MRSFALFAFLTCIPTYADEGMWLLNQPPTALLNERHAFEPTPAFLEHMQKAAVRVGGSASFVSADGLVMTNHHVASDQLQKLSTPERNLLRDGFYARTRADEIKLPDVEARMLVSIEDVTAQVTAAASPDMSAAAANQARRERIAAIEREGEAKAGLKCDVVTLYHGARYHLYSYKRFADVRLVFAPEMQIAFFGGDNDNFEFPRFNLDVTFYRVYEDDKPLTVQHYLKWSKAGAAENDLALVIGNPGRTNRLFTVDHLKFLRDSEYPLALANLWRREIELFTFSGRSDENARIARDELFGVQNGRKVRTGQFAALQNPRTIMEKAAHERFLREFVAADPKRQTEWGSAWDDVTRAYANFAPHYTRHQLFAGRLAGGGSDLFRIARDIVRLAEELPKPSDQRLPEYADTSLKSLYRRLYSRAPIETSLETEKLAAYLSAVGAALGADDPLYIAMCGSASTRERAAALVAGTTLADVETRKRLVEAGSAALVVTSDELLRFVASIDTAARAMRKKFEDEVEAIERSAYAKIAAARFAQSGDAVAPDATGTMRLSFGPIRGYEDAGQRVPAFTDFAGLFERHEQRRGIAPFDLPQRWLDGRGKLDLRTPFNFVCTADIIGGNSGSPVVNAKGEVVGLVFDGNLDSLVGDVVYDGERNRAVAVDSRGIIESLSKIYKARELVAELTAK
ncbi:MAG: S46 family peptidase, partial [Phycisphaerae bacterium]